MYIHTYTYRKDVLNPKPGWKSKTLNPRLTGFGSISRNVVARTEGLCYLQAL